MSSSSTVPVWIWLPGRHEPTLAAHLEPGRWTYTPEYLAAVDVGGEEMGALAPDPVELHLPRRRGGDRSPDAKPQPVPVKPMALAQAHHGSEGIPGVVQDACPAGYGADRLNRRFGAQLADRQRLSPFQLMEHGPADSVGALEVCQDIQAKLNWVPHTLSQLGQHLDKLEEDAPASRAARLLEDDAGTSAGGERPKLTVQHEGKLWLLKMQDRGDAAAMPAREFVVMSLAAALGLRVPELQLHSYGERQVFMIARFDRKGVDSPLRALYASAHTVLRLEPAATPGDPRRSYLVLADRMRSWYGPGRTGELQADLVELWRRMAFNALVGNVDDHPRNHGLLHEPLEGEVPGWRLSPLFDVTPALRSGGAGGTNDGALVLSMATGADGSCLADAQRLLASCGHFGLTLDQAAVWLQAASQHIAKGWEKALRAAATPAIDSGSPLDALVGDCRAAFGLSELLASAPTLITDAHGAAEDAGRRRQRRRPG